MIVITVKNDDGNDHFIVKVADVLFDQIEFWGFMLTLRPLEKETTLHTSNTTVGSIQTQLDSLTLDISLIIALHAHW